MSELYVSCETMQCRQRKADVRQTHPITIALLSLKKTR